MLDNYEFPKSCFLKRNLSEGSVDQVSKFEKKELDEYLKEIKNDFK